MQRRTRGQGDNDTDAGSVGQWDPTDADDGFGDDMPLDDEEEEEGEGEGEGMKCSGGEAGRVGRKL